MENLLASASTYTDLAFLRVLQLVHHQTSLLVEDLKNYELPAMAPKSPVDAEMTRSFGNPPGAVAATSTSVTNMLETAMEELFVPYTEGQRYLERESRSLSELFSSYLANFTRYHVRRHFLAFHWDLTVRRRELRKGNHQCLTEWSIN
jgi:hypothetical protein